MLLLKYYKNVYALQWMNTYFFLVTLNNELYMVVLQQTIQNMLLVRH
jgi:hypothetical protein